MRLVFNDREISCSVAKHARKKALGKQNRRRMNPESVLEGSGTNEEVSPVNAPRTTS